MSDALARARSFLFVPADRPERLPKALASDAHAAIVDLEDAVATEHKPAARAQFAAAFAALPHAQRGRLLVRINAAATPWHEEDMSLLRRLAGQGLGGLVLPKAETAAAVERAARVAAAPVMPLVESAAGLHALEAVARARGVLRLAFGNLDFQGDTGMQCGDDERELDPVRLAFVLVSRRAGLPAPVDGVTADLQDEARLRVDALRSRRFGFGAKLCIHPRQAAVVNETLAPTEAERAWAQRVLQAASQAASGAFRLDGQMIDAPVLARARSYLAG